MTYQPTRQETRRELETPRGTLRYHVWGDGPAVLMLHGSGPGVSGWGNFGHNLGALGEHFTCLVLEFPGYGISDAVDAPPPVATANAVVDLLDGLGLDRVDVVGNSMGGAVATRFAIADPERVRRLVTIGGIGINILNPFPSEGIVLLSRFAEDPSPETLRTWLRSMVHDDALVTDELLAERWELASAPAVLGTLRETYGEDALAKRARLAAESLTPPYWAQLHLVRAPTLMLWGRDDRVSPLDMAMLPMRHIPQAELHVYPDCGHWVMHEQPRAFERHVVEFFERPGT